MSIKTRLFGHPWQHRDPLVRAQAVAESNAPELREELGRIAEHDDSASVRLAALARINTEPFWLDARLRESDPAIVEAADAFLIKAVMQAPSEKLATERLEWFSRFNDPEFNRHVARHAPDRALRAEALRHIDSPGFLGDRVVEEPDDAIAVPLIERIEQRSTLERIESKLRKSSKRRARAVQEHLHALQAQSGEYDAATESASRIIERAERVARGQFEGDRKAELEALEASWAELADPAESLERRFRGAVDIVRRSFEAAARPRNVESIAPAEPPTETDETLRRHVERLESLASIENLSPDEAAKLLGDFDRAWQSLAAPSEAEQALRERALPVLKQLQQRRENARTTAPRAKPQSEEALPASDWDGDLDRLARALEEGQIAPAQAELRELRSRLDRVKPRQRPEGVAGRLSRLEGRLREMRDWEHWSNNQHRDELIDRIERLAEDDLHPDAITAALKEARQEWQNLENLEVLPGDKRRHAAPSGQWRRFQAACKQAFEKAEPFFEKRHEVQAESLEQLDRFLEAAHERADADAPDLEQLKKTQRAARQAIRRLDDLPPKTRGRAAARLRELMDRISSRLDEGFEAVENKKRRLVREAEALSRETDLKSAIEQAKALQARWKEAGSGRRKIEQELWIAFRAPIDPLFEQLKEASQEHREQQAAEQAEMRALVEHAEQLAAGGESELDAAAGRLRSLRDEFKAHGKRSRGLAERLDNADRKLADRLAERRAAKRRADEARREAWADSIQAAWRARLAGDAPSDPPAMDAAETDEILQTLSTVHQGLNDAGFELENWQGRVADNASTARNVLIEMEFLSGLDSPAEDRQARMNFQVERLAQRMGQGDRSPGLREELAALRQRWYASLPLPEDQFEPMAKRFHKCQNVLESMTGTE